MFGEIYLPIAAISINLDLLLLIGLSCGVLSGLYGIGGGIVLTPMLIFIGIPSNIAIGTSFNIMCGTAFSGSIKNYLACTINFAIGNILICGGLVGSGIGLLFFHILQKSGNLDVIIKLIYIVVTLIASFIMAYNTLSLSWNKPQDTRNDDARHIYAKQEIYLIIAIGLTVGIVSSMIGIGGAILTVPVLMYVMRISFIVASATTLYQVMFTSICASILQTTSNNTIDIVLSICILSTSIIGVQIGSKLSRVLNQYAIRACMTILILSICIRFILITFVDPKTNIIIMR